MFDTQYSVFAIPPYSIYLIWLSPVHKPVLDFWSYLPQFPTDMAEIFSKNIWIVIKKIARFKIFIFSLNYKIINKIWDKGEFLAGARRSVYDLFAALNVFCTKTGINLDTYTYTYSTAPLS